MNKASVDKIEPPRGVRDKYISNIHTMTIINTLLNTLNVFLSERVNRRITVGMTNVGSWLVADDDLEVAALVVIRYMLKHGYTSIGHIHMHTNDNKVYTLFYHDNLATLPNE